MIANGQTETAAPPRGDEAKVDVFDEMSRHWARIRHNAAWYIQSTRDMAAARARSVLLKALAGAAAGVAALTIFVSGCALLIWGVTLLVQSRFDLSMGASCCLVGGALIVLLVAAAATALTIWRRRHKQALLKKYNQPEAQRGASHG